MSKEAGDILYSEEEYLNLGANYEEPEDKSLDYAGLTELHIIDMKEDKEDEVYKCDNKEEDKKQEETEEIIENTVIEAKLVAKKMKELLDSRIFSI